MSCIRENLRVRSFIFIGLVTILITASFSDKVFAQKSKIKYDGDYFYETVTGYVGDEKIYSLNKKQPLFWNELANDFETLKIKFDEGYSPAYIDIDKGGQNEKTLTCAGFDSDNDVLCRADFCLSGRFR